MKEAIILIGHGATATDTPRPIIAELKRLEGERMARREMKMSPREAELDKQVRDWPRTPQNDAYKAGVDEIARALAPKLDGRKLVVAYNEFCAPSVEDAIEGLVSEGFTRISLISTMFTRGGLHAECEIPGLVIAATKAHPGVKIEYAWPFEPDFLADFLASQLKRALGVALAAALLLCPLPSSAQAWRSYFPAPATARTAVSCPRVDPVMVAGTQGYADSLGGGKCFVSIHPMSTGMVYRDYALFSDGMLMVFNSYGEAEGPDMTSAREFYFFPRAGVPQLEMDPAAGTVAVVMADGGRVSFDPPTAQISALERGAVTVSPSLDRAARGGVEISSYRGLMLDCGFRLGELPSGRSDADSTFRSSQGQTCTVKNREIFVYEDKDRSLKYGDAELSSWLKKRCPGLFVGF